MSSEVAAIVDYTAQLAAAITGVSAVFGAGQGAYADPLRPGHVIRAAPRDPVAQFEHWSGLPSTPLVEYVTQEGIVEITWTVPMLLWLLRADTALLRATALPFYDRYLAAFVPDPRLGDLVLHSTITRFAIGENEMWAWLAIDLAVTEQVSY